MSIWLPETARRQADEVAQLDAVRREMADARLAEDIEYAKDITRRLRALDERLELVFCGEHASGPGIVPGRWHVRRDNPGTADSYIAVTGPNGEYAEPGERVFEELRRADMWRGDPHRRRLEREAAEEQNRQRDKDRMREERLDEIRLRLKAKVSPGVLFSDRPWTWRAGARRDRRRAA